MGMKMLLRPDFVNTVPAVGPIPFGGCDCALGLDECRCIDTTPQGELPGARFIQPIEEWPSFRSWKVRLVAVLVILSTFGISFLIDAIKGAMP